MFYSLETNTASTVTIIRAIPVIYISEKSTSAFLSISNRLSNHFKQPLQIPNFVQK